ncbi:MAG: prepilin peptidase [Candidatus Yonathbacteria bacterium]|nr:prepilin peptidase [Candidatus Yonathbacteria bacterium]
MLFTFFFVGGVFLLGTVIGSFLNVVILRLGSGRSIVNDRSGCPSCGTTLAWYDLIPIASFVALRGRCRSCQSRIALQYPIVEMVTGGVFAFLAWRLAPVVLSGTSVAIQAGLDLVLLWVITSFLVVLTVYDLRHMILPDSVTYLFIACAFIYAILPAVYAQTLFSGIFFDIAAGPLAAIPFLILWLVSGGKWMGLGDAKLVLGMGFLLGFTGVWAALLVAFWVGAIWGLTLIGMHRGKALLGGRKGFTMKSEVPFGPFLVFGTAFVFLSGIDVLAWALSIGGML